jgi:hypothetical protein
MQINRVYWPASALDYIREKRAAAAMALADHFEIPPAPSIAKATPSASSRRFTFTLSSDRADRMGDVINQRGWDLSEFARNPVALFAHNSSGMPIGTWKNVRLEGNKLKGDLAFASTPRAREARDLVEANEPCSLNNQKRRLPHQASKRRPASVGAFPLSGCGVRLYVSREL